MSAKIKTDEWFGCYSGSWQSGPLVPAAYAHPAKVSFGLAKRIYQHAIEQGYLYPGCEVVDPFGGIAGFALHAITNGINYTGVELEQNFVTLGNQNIDLWNGRYQQYFAEKGKPFGTARLIQGDSRNLAALVGLGAEMCVSSPPYAGSLTNDKRTGGSFDQEMRKYERYHGPHSQASIQASYGDTAGQLGSMPEGSFTAAVSSPPYADAVNGNGEGPGARHDPIYHNGDNAYKASNGNEYGRTPGNLGNMGGYQAAVSSPPFMESGTGADKESRNRQVITSGVPSHKNGAVIGTTDYGYTAGQLANDKGDFWTAARAIVEQVYTVLRPGGHAIWVTGDFVRDGRRVYFGRQWQELCTAAGFVPVEWIVAHKSESKGVQLDIFGNAISQSVDRVSFFRRLANEKNPDAAILNEDVIIMRKSL